MPMYRHFLFALEVLPLVAYNLLVILSSEKFTGLSEMSYTKQLTGLAEPSSIPMDSTSKKNRTRLALLTAIPLLVL